MYKIIINQQDLMNLKVFLERVDLKGKEVLAYANVLNAVNKAEEEDLEKVGE